MNILRWIGTCRNRTVRLWTSLLAVWLWSGALLSAYAEDKVTPVRLRIAGQEVSPDLSAVTDGKELYLPLEALSYVQAQSKPNEKGDKAIISLAASQLLGELPLRKFVLKVKEKGEEREKEALFVLLSDLAKFLSAEIRTVSQMAIPGLDQAAPDAQEDIYLLLARIKTVQYDKGQLRVTTSFPIQFQGQVQTETVPARGYVDCIGAYLPKEFAADPIAGAEGQMIRLTLQERSADTVRVNLEQTTAIGGVGMPYSPDLPADAPRQRTQLKGPLLLNTVLQQVEVNYPKIRSAELERRIATAKRTEKQGAFDPELLFGRQNLRYNSSSSPGRALNANTTDFSVVFPTPLGLKLEFGGRFNFGAIKSPDSSTGTSGEYFLSLKMPLVRGLGINEKAAAERQARLGIPLADQDFALERIDIVLKSIITYWKWVASGRKLQVSRDLLTVAQQRAEFLRKRFEAGDARYQDVILAEQQVQNRLVRVASSERSVQEAAFNLGLFLFEPDGVTSFVPAVDNIPEYNAVPQLLTPQQIEQGRRLALERRPELKSLTLQREIVRIDRSLARNDRLPEVNLVYNPGFDTGARGIDDTLKLGVTVAIPLRTRGADGRIDAANLKLSALDQKETFERQRILTDLADTVNAISNAYQRYVFAEKSLQLARIAEQGVRDDYAAGGASLIEVNLAEQNTADAANALIDIQADYEQALAAFRAVTVQPFLP